MTGTRGKVVCFECLCLKKDCKCALPELHIRPIEWIIEQRLERKK